jgi:hypothetical protein
MWTKAVLHQLTKSTGCHCAASAFAAGSAASLIDHRRAFPRSDLSTRDSGRLHGFTSVQSCTRGKCISGISASVLLVHLYQESFHKGFFSQNAEHSLAPHVWRQVHWPRQRDVNGLNVMRIDFT